MRIDLCADAINFNPLMGWEIPSQDFTSPNPTNKEEEL
jgi:hypothetical protein